jgi:alanyl-tRNA synthetase
VCSGMQQLKHLFKDSNHVKTMSNVQQCLRVIDLDEINDGRHCLYFNMLGLFSFRQWTVKQTIDFWMDFLMTLNIKIDYVTIHPDKFLEWKDYYQEYPVEIRQDHDCVWSDGEIGGYDTEFYVNDIEIGNIVNTNGDCIDVGFGLERLCMVSDPTFSVSEISVLKETILKLIESGYVPGNKQQGYVMRKLLRLFLQKGGIIEHPIFLEEKNRQERIFERYGRLKDKYKHKSKEWWYDTHGIDLDLI